ncbi:hypothetical protein IW150_006795, partial [Coemansia sp. RSA 2607]
MPSPPPLAMASSSSSPFPYYGEPDEEKRVTTDSGSFKNELKEEDEEDSPFEMVRAAVSNKDDTSLP